MNKFTSLSVWGLLALGLSFLQSCDKLRIYDDQSNCFGNRLIFSYHADDKAKKEHLLEYVDLIHVYFYDQQGNMVLQKQLPKSTLTNYPGMSFELEPGTYRVVAIGNALERTMISNPEHPQSALVGRPELVTIGTNADKTSENTSDPLYLGETSVRVDAGLYATDTLRFHSEHVLVKTGFRCGNVQDEAKWYEGSRGNRYYVRMTPAKAAPAATLPACFGFNATHYGQTSYDVALLQADDKHRFDASYYTLRFENNSPLRIQLWERADAGDHLLYDADFLDYMARYGRRANPTDGIEITDLQEAVLPIYFYQNPLTLAVKVAPWEEVATRPVVE